MTHFVIEAAGIGTLVLTKDELATCRARAAELLRDIQPVPIAPSTDEPALLDAEQMEGRTGIPSSWWMAQAREQRIPHQKIGRRVRFDFAAVMASDAVRKREAF